jgi:catechol 2,3-dioxygenase-like lactoylglutathione lyase family enzyme
MAERRRHTPGAGPHPNGVRFLERVYIVVEDLEASVALYAKVLGASEPRMYKGTVIMSHMAVFQYGAAGLTIAHPVRAGTGRRRARAPRPRPFPGALPHHEHGRGGALDGTERHAASGGRNERYRRESDARGAGAGVRGLHRVRRAGV